jgi:integrase
LYIIFTSIVLSSARFTTVKTKELRDFTYENLARDNSIAARHIKLSHRKSRARTNKHIKGNRALTIDRVPENADVRKLISHRPIHGKAFTLLLVSSGTRRGEALGSKLGNVMEIGDILRIEIPGAITKAGNSRVTFASREAKEAIQEWLKVREQYLKTAVARAAFLRI